MKKINSKSLLEKAFKRSNELRKKIVCISKLEKHGFTYIGEINEEKEKVRF